MTKIETVYIKVVREGTDVNMTIKLHEAIYNFIKSQCGEMRPSGTWRDKDGNQLEMFLRKDGVLSSYIKEKFDLDAYGSDGRNGFISHDGKPNVAIFRTVGLDEGKTINIKGAIAEESLKQIVSTYKQFCRDVYNTFVKKVVVESRMYEVV